MACRNKPDVRQRISVKPGSQEKVSRLVSAHCRVCVTDRRPEEGFELGLVLSGDEGQSNVRYLLRGRLLGAPALGLRAPASLERGSHLGETGGLGLDRRRRGVRGLRRWMRRSSVEGARLPLGWLMLLLLLLELRLVLLGDGRHGRCTSLEALRRRRRAREARILRLKLPGSLGLLLLLRHAGRLGLDAQVAGVLLLLLRRLAEAGGLGRERARLLLRLLLGVERAAVLLLPRAQAVAAAQEGA